MNLNDSTLQRNMIFDDFRKYVSIPVLALIFDEFWHRFWLHFGTPLASNSMFLGDRFFDDFLNRDFIIFDQKWFQKVGDGTLPFRSFFASFFRTLVPFTNVRPTSARNHVFQLFQKIKRMYPHLYLLLT